ncbi:MAG TPA: SDR family oxidoreductase [Candidatus Binatia bacterium]|nr:SDR family oxidoreductase [Candidatus Binatia bacterium]
MAQPVVVVTGASSGIGEALARRLARDRHQLVLVARRTERLEALAAELADRHAVTAHVIATDLLQPGAPTALAEEIERRDLQVDWLINNAGFGTAGRFDRMPVARELDEIRLNVKAPVELTGRILPGMVRRGRGVVMHIASVAGYGPTPYSSTYGATKAFLIAWSEAMVVELEGTGVNVVCVCPGFTRTEFQEKASIDASAVPSFAWQSAEMVADEAVRSSDRSGVVVNGVLNNVGAVLMRLAPRSMLARATASALRGKLG